VSDSTATAPALIAPAADEVTKVTVQLVSDNFSSIDDPELTKPSTRLLLKGIKVDKGDGVLRRGLEDE
jgi:hypothetical protein